MSKRRISPARPLNFWYERIALIPGGRWQIRAYRSAHHPDGETVGPGLPDGSFPADAVVAEVDLDSERRLRVVLSEWALPGAPSLWFVRIPSESAGRPQESLVAYASSHFADGTVITNAMFFTVPVRSSEQIGAVRWWADSGLIDQVFVREEERLAHVAMKLVYTADGVHQHQGWPGHIHVGGERTDLGQRVVEARKNDTRVAPLTQRSRLRQGPQD